MVVIVNSKQIMILLSLFLPQLLLAVEDESNFYYGISAGQGEAEIKKNGVVNVTERLSGGALMLGYEFTPALSAEVRLSRMTGESSADSANAYVRIAYPGDNLKAYLLLGGGVTDVTAKSGGVSFDLDALNVDEPVASAGVGLALFGNDTTALTIEAVSSTSDDISIPMYSIGFQHYFGGHK